MYSGDPDAPVLQPALLDRQGEVVVALVISLHNRGNSTQPAAYQNQFLLLYPGLYLSALYFYALSMYPNLSIHPVINSGAFIEFEYRKLFLIGLVEK